MNTGEKIDYMIQCLKVAKAEWDYMADYIANEPTERSELWEFLDTHRSPNKALIKDNLKNVARMGFQLANGRCALVCGYDVRIVRLEYGRCDAD